jgi:type VI secretion system Hcp family effector
MAIYMKVTGSKSGWIKGAVGAKNFTDYIEVNSLEFGMGSPFDPHTGQSTGRRVLRPLKVVKPVDKSSPLLVTSCDTNEVATVNVVYTKEGAEHAAYLKLDLTNAMVRDFNHLASFDGMAVETLSFSFTKAEFTWVDGGIVASMDWTGAS